MMTNRIATTMNQMKYHHGLGSSGNESSQCGMPLAGWMLTREEIYRLARQLAERDYQINRLFNPQFYEI